MMSFYDDGWKPSEKSQNHKMIEYEVDERGCWVCTSHGYKNPKKRPQVKRNGKMLIISRVVYEHHNNEKIPEGLFVLHSCDNKKCINPEHLRLGTQKENMEDMYSRDRQPYLKGSKSGSTELTEKDVYEIKYLYISGSMTSLEISKLYPVKVSRVQEICRDNGWEHVICDYNGEDRRHFFRRQGKLDVTQVREIKSLFKTELTNKEIGERYGVGSECIRSIRNEKSWSHVTIN